MSALQMDAAGIHACLGRGRWPEVLHSLGVGDEYLRRKKQGPCPVCGGRDRYCFDDKHGRGDFICRHCGAGDGFTLLMRLHGWDFATARRRVVEAAGIALEQRSYVPLAGSNADAVTRPARPTPRVREIRRGACDTCDAQDAREYLASRALWPLPADCSLRAHASLEYWQGRERLGRYAALIADVRDAAGELVTVHVTYLQHGRKLERHEPRKLLSPVNGRAGCAVRLLPLPGDTLGIAEGLETALSAYQLHRVPTWSALNTALLSRFEPPPGVRRVIAFADRDVPGLEAAARLMERLQGRVAVELRTPPAPHKDWNDALTTEPHRVAERITPP